jgi:hypothetical protein
MPLLPIPWTHEQLEKVASTLLDRSIQKTLLDNPDHPDAWTLHYLMDSSLRAEFEEAMEIQQTKDSLEAGIAPASEDPNPLPPARL